MAWTYKKPYIFLAALISILLFIFLFFPVKSAKHPPQPTIAVTAAKVKSEDVTITTQTTGNVQPYLSVAVKSRVEGELRKVNFKEGDYVKAGQVILEIDTRPFEVSLQQVKATLAKDQAQFENYTHILKRYAALAKKGYVSKQDYDQAEANVKTAAATLLADKAQVAQAKLNLDYCKIRAPLSGRTGKVLINLGNMIKVTDVTPLVIINQIQPIYISFSLPQQYLSPLLNAMRKTLIPVHIHIKNPAKMLVGTITFLDNTVDTSTGMVQLKALYPNKEEELWPGLYVNVQIPVHQIKHAKLIPTRAIQASPEGSFVFIINKDARVSKKIISIGPEIHGQTVIEGLEVGAWVVTTGQTQLVPQSLVKVIARDSLS